MNDHIVESASVRAATSTATRNDLPRAVPDKTYGYSRLFGTFYERGSALERRINAVKADIGETAVKHGFAALPAGLREDVLGQSLARNPLTVQGLFEGAGFYRHEASGQEYVRVGLRDEKGLSSVSVALDSDLGKSIVRKLANVELEVGKPVALQAIAFAQSSERDGKTYVEHRAALWQGEKKVEAISVAPLLAAEEEMRAKLASVGIDARTARSALYRLEADWHRERLREAIARFAGREGNESAKVPHTGKDASAQEGVEEQADEQDMGR